MKERAAETSRSAMRHFGFAKQGRVFRPDAGHERASGQRRLRQRAIAPMYDNKALSASQDSRSIAAPIDMGALQIVATYRGCA